MILLFNPRATNHNPRIPNSVLQIAASIDGIYEWVIVDGNLEKDPWTVIENYLSTGKIKYFGCTVMPGPQLKQAIPFTKKIRASYPHIKIIFGGYFASNQYKVNLDSGYVDYIVNGPGDNTFPQLINAIENNLQVDGIKNLIYKKDEQIFKQPRKNYWIWISCLHCLIRNSTSFILFKNYFLKLILEKKPLPIIVVLVVRLHVHFAQWFLFIMRVGKVSQHKEFTMM